MEETKKCPFCGKEILAIAKKCKYCGKWMDEEHTKKEQKQCPVCGEMIDADATTCPYCKEDVSAYQEEKTPEPSVIPVEVKEQKEEKQGKQNQITPIIIAFFVIAIVFILIRCLLKFVFYDDVTELYYINDYWFIPIYLNIVVDVLAVVLFVLICFSKKMKRGISRFSGSISNNSASMSKGLSASIRKLFDKQNRYILIGLICIVVIFLGGLVVQQSNKRERERKEQAINNRKAAVANYESNATTFKRDASIIYVMSDIILKDYHDNWVSAIYDNVAKDVNGRKRHCRDFQIAVDWRMEYYSNLGCMDCLDSIETDMSNAFMEMDKLKEIPEKYSSLKESYDEIRSKASEAVDQCKSPSGNISEFGSTTNTLLTDLSNAIDQTDIYIDSQNTDAREFVFGILQN